MGRGSQRGHGACLKSMRWQFDSAPRHHFAPRTGLSVNLSVAHFVYIVKCSDKSLYTGITWSLRKRVSDHNQGLVPFTKNRRPVELVYWEEYHSIKETARREKEIKGWKREKKEWQIRSLP